MPARTVIFSIGCIAIGLAAAEASAAASILGGGPLPPPRPTNLAGPAPASADETKPGDPKPKAAKAPETVVPTAGLHGSRSAYRAILKREAERSGLPADVADAVTAIESGYDPSVIGGVGEIGLMQVRPETAAMLGFKGDANELARPEVNIHYGVTYLAGAWRLANGDLCRALMKYRAGHGEEVMSPLSVTYCGRARAHLAALGSPLAEGASAPFVYAPLSPKLPPIPRGPRIRTAAVSQAFWAAHEARIRILTRRVEAKWRRRMASR